MAEWNEIDIKNRVWVIPAKKMKMSRDHIVPLTDTVIEIIELNRDNGSKYLFPSPWSSAKPISENTMNIALKRMGYDGVMTSHGFRHTASTILHENIHIHKISSDVIEIQMAHIDGSVRGVYNKAIYLAERENLMNWWSEYINKIKKI